MGRMQRKATKEYNPLIDAVAICEELVAAEKRVDMELRGPSAVTRASDLEVIHKFVFGSAVAVAKLGPRGRVARLNAMWKAARAIAAEASQGDGVQQ